jgi:hypothetical protein
MKHIGTHLTDNGKVYIYNKFPSGYELRCSRCGRKTAQNQVDNSLLEEDIKISVVEALVGYPTEQLKDLPITSPTGTPEVWDPIKHRDIRENPRFCAQGEIGTPLEVVQ